MLIRLLFLFVTIPLIELYLLLQLADWTGAAATFALVLVTGVIGSWLAKREGMIAWQRFHSVASQGKIPSREIQDGLMIVFAGALLLTPGLITDAVGFWLLLPFGRQLVRKYFLAGRVRGFSNVKFYASASASQAAEPLHPSFDDSRTVEGRVSSGGRSGRSVEG